MTTTFRIKGRKSLPILKDTPKSKENFLKKLHELIEAGETFETDLHYNPYPETPFDKNENDTVIWMEFDKYAPDAFKFSEHTPFFYLKTMLNAPTLEISDDWDYTETNAKRRYVSFKAIYNG